MTEIATAILTLSALLLTTLSASIYPYVRFQIWCLGRSIGWSILQVMIGVKWTMLLTLGLHMLSLLQTQF